ncbi:MAG: ATP-dependent helicase [Nitriliruptorales bacterium]|nr:ATP-dependent helicase [Nitriliruptorales bacterium]
MRRDDAAGIATVAARLVGLDEAVPALLRVPTGARRGLHRAPDSLRAWAVATRLAVGLVSAHRVVPALSGGGDAVAGSWRALVDEDADAAAAFAHLAAAMPVTGFAVALSDRRVWEPAALLRAYADAVADLLIRLGGPPPRPGRPRARLLPWTARWAEALADPQDASVPLRDEADELVAGVTGWLGGAADRTAGIVELHLASAAQQNEPWPLRFTLRTDDGTLLDAADVWRGDPDDPETVVRQETLLRGLARCARVFPPLDGALSEPEPEAVDLEPAQAWQFICDAAPLLRSADLVVVVPPDVATEDVRLRLRLAAPSIAPEDDGDVTAEQLHGESAGYEWEISLGDEPLEDWELDSILDAGSPLVRWRERWVRLDPDEVRRLRGLGPGGSVTLVEALALGLAGSATVGDFLGEGSPLAREHAEVVVDGALGSLLDRVRAAADRPPAADDPEGFVGRLRPYQRRGVAWLQGMGDLGLGAILADDMGLGKTIQFIAYLLLRPQTEPVLVICPTSVVGNWQREIHRFAPGLRVTRWHGVDRPENPDEAQDVVVTTYGTLRRDVDALASRQWSIVALDEAQQIKNPQTAGAKAVRRLRRRQTVALTGTPLENRLAELWALFDVTNAGLLGRRADFTRRFVKRIEHHHDRATAVRLRRLVAPFILRREKSDPSVIADLPPKIERTVTCPLTPEQARLYQAALDRVLDRGGLEQASAMERRGRVLALLTELKQICNHPAHYLREDSSSLMGRSGKLAAAREIIAEAVAGEEQVLLFTQYVSMGRLLVDQLQSDLGTEVPFLHGGLTAPARDRLVSRFQARIEGEGDSLGDPPPVLVISLRAGGTGVNLTAATQVIHYDRWWNPAVEDQATDRAHRIGQRRTVEVHKLVTAGTLEERIDDLLGSKRALAATIVGAGESWVTELGDSELRDLLSLSADAEIAELDEDAGDLVDAGVGR